MGGGLNGTAPGFPRGYPWGRPTIPPAMEIILRWVDPVAIAVLAASGALEASRKRMDAVGFILIAAVTGLGGGTVRDLLLGRTPIFWLHAPALLAVCATTAVVVFFFAHLVESRFRALLWADAVGLALYAVAGANTALTVGSDPWAAVLLGTVTASRNRETSSGLGTTGSFFGCRLVGIPSSTTHGRLRLTV